MPAAMIPSSSRFSLCAILVAALTLMSGIAATLEAVEGVVAAPLA